MPRDRDGPFKSLRRHPDPHRGTRDGTPAGGAAHDGRFSDAEEPRSKALGSCRLSSLGNGGYLT